MSALVITQNPPRLHITRWRRKKHTHNLYYALQSPTLSGLEIHHYCAFHVRQTPFWNLIFHFESRGVEKERQPFRPWGECVYLIIFSLREKSPLSTMVSFRKDFVIEGERGKSWKYSVSSAGCAAHLLCDLKKVTFPLWALTAQVSRLNRWAVCYGSLDAEKAQNVECCTFLPPTQANWVDT